MIDRMTDDEMMKMNEGGQSLSQNMYNIDDPSYGSHSTKDESPLVNSKSHSSNCLVKSENGYFSKVQTSLKINMNRNKMQGTCREYKHLDDEWTFDVDEF